MYRILSDGYTVYDPRLPDNAILSGKLNLEVNKAGSLEFTIPERNPHYGMIALMKSIVTVYDDDKLIFRGRPYAPSRNLYRDNEITCEGELAFFNDTYQEPFEFYGTVTDLFTQVITAHNSQVSSEKQFKVGTVNVVNNTIEGYITRSSIEYLTTWEFIEDKFLDPLGGYLHTRYETDGVYIDYLSELNFVSGQDVQQGINLVDVSEEVSTEDLATAIIPLGAKLTDDEGNTTDEYLTIENVNPSGKVYVSDADGVATYGWIVKVVKHDDITLAENLLTAGQADLAAALGVATTIDLRAADLSRAGYAVSPFAIGTKIPVKIDSLNVDESMLLQKLTIDLLAPESNQITLGATSRSFVADKINTDKTIININNSVSDIQNVTNSAINQIYQEMASSIEQTEEYILSTVTEGYYTKDEAESLIAELTTQIEQNAGGIEIRFEQLQQQVTDVGNTIVEQSQFIRLENGEIVIGKSDSPIVSVYTNNALEFRYNGMTVAKFTNEILEVRNMQVENQLKMHLNWAWRRGQYQSAVGGYNLDLVYLG